MSGEQEETAQQTLYVAIQPGANMDSSQIEQAQPAVFVEVVEASSGGEIESTAQVVQEEMVIDNSKCIHSLDEPEILIWSACTIATVILFIMIINNYLPRWRWIAVDIYCAASAR